MRLTFLRASFVLAHALFLWMYFSAEPLELMARSGGFATTGPAVVEVVDRYAAAWRHGMADNACLYLPGFFLAAAFTWLWALGRPLRTLAVEGAALLAVAVLVAAPLAHRGTDLALESLRTATGLRASVAPPGFTFHGALLALFTILTWDTGVLCCQQSIARRSLWPMWIPAILNVVLANVRPWTVADFTTQWIVNLRQGRAVAILSACAVPLLSAFLVLCQLSSERRRARNAAEPVRSDSSPYAMEAGQPDGPHAVHDTGAGEPRCGPIPMP